MSTYTLVAAEVLQVFRGIEYRMIDLQITSVDGKFQHRAMPFRVTVRDGNTSVEAFHTRLSPDEKALHGYFTTNAFAAFPGNVDVSFGYEEQPIDGIADVSIAVVSLPPFLAALGRPAADNNWLANL